MCSTARASDEPVLADTRKGRMVWPLRSSAAATTQRPDRNGPPCWRNGNRWSRRMTAFASRQPTIPHTRPTVSAVASTTGAYDPISYVGATERPTSSGLNTGLWGRNERTQTPRWCDKWNDAVRHGPSAVNERCHVRTSGDASARFATSRAIIPRPTIAVAHWNDAET
jgi:hypothetical protein